MEKNEILHRIKLLRSYEDTDVFKKMAEKLVSMTNDPVGNLWRGYEAREMFRSGGLRVNADLRISIIKRDIVIDLLAGNSKLATDEIIKMGDEIIENAPYEFSDKYYSPLRLKTSDAINIEGLTKWERIFVENYYGQIDIDGTTPTLSNRTAEQVKKDCIDVACKFQRNANGLFFIDSRSKEVSKKADKQLKSKKFTVNTVDFLADKKREICDQIALKYSERLDDEYKHILHCLSEGKYDSAFTALVLRETAMKVYKINNGSIEIRKRKLTETIDNHMDLNKPILDFMYNNVDRYDNFAELYFAAVKNFNNSVRLGDKRVSENIPTFGKGYWLMFRGGKLLELANAYKDSEELSIVLYNTIYKAEKLRGSLLKGGYLYIFINSDNKPCLSVSLRTYDNTVKEIQKITEDGEFEEIEFNDIMSKAPEYYEVLVSFLTNNEKISEGKEYCIEEAFADYKIDDYASINEEELQSLMRDISAKQEFWKFDLIKDKIMETFNCTEDEICFGDYLAEQSEKICPYKVILGKAKFDYCYNITSLGNLRFVGGDASFFSSSVESLANLRYIGGNADFHSSRIKDLGDLEFIGGNGNFDNNGIEGFSNLKNVVGEVKFKSVEQETAYYEHMAKMQGNNPEGMHL